MHFFNRVSNRILFLIGVIVMLLILSSVLIVFFEVGQNRKVVQTEMSQKQKLVRMILKMSAQPLEIFTFDYTYWDDMVSYLRKPDPAWAVENIEPGLTTYHLNAVWVCDTNLGLIYHNSRDIALKTDHPDWLQPGLAKKLRHTHFLQFYFMISNMLFETHSAPIQPTYDRKRETEPQGYFFAAKAWDTNHLSEISRLLEAEARILTSFTRVPDAVTEDKGNNRFFVNYPFVDIYGNTIAILEMVFPLNYSRISFSGSLSRFLIHFINLFLVVVFLAIFLSLWVTRPLKRISNALDSGSPEMLESLSGSYNEFGQIGDMIRVSLEQKEKLQKEIEERIFLEERLTHMAMHDALTGLPNRILFRDRMHIALESAKRKKKQSAVLFLDIDRFKEINDTLGHQAGDQLLKQIARRLESCVRTTDTVSRMGGDEFTMILTELDGDQEMLMIINRIQRSFSLPFQLEEKSVQMHSSIGISLYPDNGESPDELMRFADIALYRAKSGGKNTYRLYHSDFGIMVSQRAEMEKNLRRAMENHEFSLYFQPQIELPTGRLIGAEALIRWFPPDGKMVPPDLFLPFAEETGLIIPIGEWVLKTACREAVKWEKAGYPGLSIAVNLSARQLYDREIVERVKESLEETGLPPGQLELEVTESSALGDEEKSREIIQELRQLGAKVAIDDFGTGYSSFGYLKHFQFDTLKIGQIFVKNIVKDAGDQAIYIAITDLAASLGINRVVTEGVETRDQLTFVNRKPRLIIQGYYFSRPLPAESFMQLLSQNQGRFPV